MIFARCRIHQVELADAVFVGYKGNSLAVIAQGKLFYVPFNVWCEIRRLHAGKIEVCETLILRIAVGGGIETLSVFAEPRPSIGNFLAAGLWRKQLLFAS